jgi:small-conductance mechanosensitive channel
VQNVKSEVMLALWDKFQEHGIEIPYPQRDVHIREDQSPRVVERISTPDKNPAGAGQG